jgi:hypothetical protein
MKTNITTDDCVRALKSYGCSATALGLSVYMMGDGSVSSRAVATSLRGAVADGRVSLTYRKPARGQQRCGHYRFKRLTAKVTP